MTYVNIKSHKRPGFYPLFRRYILRLNFTILHVSILHEVSICCVSQLMKMLSCFNSADKNQFSMLSKKVINKVATIIFKLLFFNVLIFFKCLVLFTRNRETVLWFYGGVLFKSWTNI